MDQYQPNQGGFTQGGTGTLTIPGKKKYYLKVDPYGFSGVSYDYFQMLLKGFGNSEYLSFYYTVYHRNGKELQKETRIYMNRSLAFLQSEKVASGLAWDLDDAIYYFGVSNGGPSPAYTEVIWIGGNLPASPGNPPGVTQPVEPPVEDSPNTGDSTVGAISWTLPGLQILPPPFHNVMYGENREGNLEMIEPWRRWFTALIERLNYKITPEDLLRIEALLQNAAEDKANKVVDVSEGSNNFAILASDGDIGDSGKSSPAGDVVGTTDVQELSNKSVLNMPSVTYVNSGATITVSNFGHMIKFLNGSNDVICYLPSVGASDIDSLISIMRLGTGRLTIRCADLDTIEKSTAGGGIYCEESGRKSANLNLYLATETKWAILGGTGIWKAF